jgi:hypothetical protein
MCCVAVGMPRYFFNIKLPEAAEDEIGEELPSDEAAWKEATMVAGELFKDLDGKFRPGQEQLDVTDENQTPVYVIHITSKKTK